MNIIDSILNDVVVPRSSLQPGDHIYAWKKLNSYSHHGIYEGDGKVINFVDFPEPLGSVKRCTLDNFLEGFPLCRLDYPNKVGNLEPTEEVLHRAKFLLKKNGFGSYSLINNNCEDFAIYCKTGCVLFENGVRVSQCTQIKAVVELAKSLIIGLPSFLYDLARDIFVNKNVRKVPVEEFYDNYRHWGIAIP